MRKRCQNCGRELSETAKTCSGCGQILSSGTITINTALYKSRRINNKILILILVIVILGVVAYFLWSKPVTIAEVAKEYCDTGIDMDSQKFIRITYTKGVSQERLDQLVTNYNNYKEADKRYWKSCELTDEKELDKEEIEALREYWNTTFKETADIAEAKQLTFIIKEDNDYKGSYHTEQIIVKIENKWYMWYNYQ